MAENCLNLSNSGNHSVMGQDDFDMMRECHCRHSIISTESVVMTTFLIVVLVITFLGNALVCLVVVLYCRMRTLTNYFIVSLAVSDLLLALLSLPFRIDQTIHNAVWCNSPSLCQVWILADIICTSASMWNLAMISIDRFIAIVLPFRYHVIMTARLSLFLIGFVWVSSVALAPLALLNWTAAGEPHWYWEIDQQQCSKRDKVFYTVVAACHFFLPLAIVVIMYTNVFRVAWSHARAVASLQQAVQPQRKNTPSTFVRELKAAKTLAIVVGTFVVCWLPFFVILLIDLWYPELQQRSDKSAASALRYTFFYALPIMNSTLNPIIYTVFNKSFRSAFKKLFSFCGRAGREELDHTTERKTTQLSYDLKNNSNSDVYGTGRKGKDSIEQETEAIELSQMNG